MRFQLLEKIDRFVVVAKFLVDARQEAPRSVFAFIYNLWMTQRHLSPRRGHLGERPLDEVPCRTKITVQDEGDCSGKVLQKPVLDITIHYRLSGGIRVGGREAQRKASGQV